MSQQYEVWVDDGSTTLIPADHPQRAMLTKGSRLLSRFEAESWDEAVARKEALMLENNE